jgi:hypothetical protein
LAGLQFGTQFLEVVPAAQGAEVLVLCQMGAVVDR